LFGKEIKMLERLLVTHCSPTLAGIKTANLFNFRFTELKYLLLQLEDMNRKLNRKGIYAEVLRIRKSSALIFVYRPKNLETDLKKNGVAEFLAQFGYEQCSVCYCISKLKLRLAAEIDFPHEIGLFLGYPIADVMGFIENAGQNCKCVGCWKVYCNECEAAKLFAQYKKCTDVYSRMFANGFSIMELIVAA
jgi:hypothetical protein